LSTKKRGLGKGLSALIPDEPINEIEEGVEGNEKVLNIDISLIEPNQEQPRREFDKEALQTLANSIKSYGVLQPIILRKIGAGYQIVAGERRWRATKEAGLKEIPAIVREIEQLKASEIALIENIQREDLNPIEEAYAYKNLVEKYGLTQEEISQAVGKSRSYIANIVRLLNLGDEVITMITNGDITNGHGRSLLAIDDAKIQLEIAKSIVDKGLSVRDTEKLVKDLEEGRKIKEKQKKQEKNDKEKDPEVVEIEESLRRILGTKVLITSGRKKGKIEIEYYSEEDLDRILDVLSKN